MDDGRTPPGTRRNPMASRLSSLGVIDRARDPDRRSDLRRHVRAGDLQRSGRMQEQAKTAWAQVENQLQRRSDLIPNYVETVKGYAKQETTVFTAIADARARMAGARIRRDDRREQRPGERASRACSWSWRTTPSCDRARTSYGFKMSWRARRTGSPRSGCATTRSSATTTADPHPGEPGGGLVQLRGDAAVRGPSGSAGGAAGPVLIA